MAAPLPESIDVAALKRYDEFVVTIAPDRVADTQELYNRLAYADNSENLEGNQLEPARLTTAFVELLEHFTSDSADKSEPVHTQTVVTVWSTLLRQELRAQKAAEAAAASAAATSMQMDDEADAATAAAAGVRPANAVEGFTAVKPVCKLSRCCYCCCQRCF